MYFLKKLVWLYAVHPWLILREKGWQLNYEVAKDAVINVQNLSVCWSFPVAHPCRNPNVLFFWVHPELAQLRYSSTSRPPRSTWGCSALSIQQPASPGLWEQAPTRVLCRENIPLSCLFSLKTCRKALLSCSIRAALPGEPHSSRCSKKCCWCWCQLGAFSAKSPVPKLSDAPG